jgi:hypothetical protein
MTSVRWSVFTHRTQFSSDRRASPSRKEARPSAAIFARLAKSGDKVVIGDRKIIVLDDNVSYATGFYEFSAVRNGEVKTSWAGFSIVLVKHANDWLIAHHHSSERSSPSPGLPLQRI